MDIATDRARMVGVLHYELEDVSRALVLQDALVESTVVVLTQSTVLHHLEIDEK